jgi:dTMP kinase
LIAAGEAGRLGFMPAAPFIVIEGVDGAGTTTHARLLAESLRARRLPVHLSAEPSAGPIGALLRQALQGRVVAGAAVGVGQALGWGTMALLFAADRLDHLEAELLPILGDGVSVICDRYYYSSIAYQSQTGGGPEAIAWLRELNVRARVPDLTIVLDVAAELAAQRRRDRRASVEIYDADALQLRLCEFYASLDRHFPGERIAHVDSSGTIAEVASRVFAAAQTAWGDAGLPE